MRLEKIKDIEQKNMMSCGTEHVKEKIRKQEEKRQDRAFKKEFMDQEMKKYEEQYEQERRDAQEMESQSLLASARRWH